MTSPDTLKYEKKSWGATQTPMQDLFYMYEATIIGEFGPSSYAMDSPRRSERFHRTNRTWLLCALPVRKHCTVVFYLSAGVVIPALRVGFRQFLFDFLSFFRDRCSTRRVYHTFMMSVLYGVLYLLSRARRKVYSKLALSTKNEAHTYRQACVCVAALH